METKGQSGVVINSVGILGGGAAGYLAALTIQKKIPGVSVTLIESPTIGTIRVGESTTDHVLSLLHDDLEFDIPAFMKEVRPVWKLGLRFNWGLPGNYFFDYGAVNTEIFDSHEIASDINLNFPSMIINGGKSLLAAYDHQPSVLGIPDEYKDVNYGYQFENGEFIRFLKTNALKWGIHFKEAVIKHVELTADKENVQYLHAEDGRKFHFDLFVDCSGFRSELMGISLGSNFRSYRESIFTDKAIVAPLPHNGNIKSCTTANTMDYGWQWITPMRDEDHIGYVFATDFCSDDEALLEMKRKNPKMGEPRVVKFPSGRHKHFWKGNVVAIGNAYGFIEPLHGIALQLIIMQIKNLINNWEFGTHASLQKEELNDLLGKQWDYAMEVLALHFKHNQKLRSPFWDACNADIRLPMMDEYHEFFEEIGPFSKLPHGIQNFLFPPATCQKVLGNFGIDTIMMGICGKKPGALRFTNPDKRKAVLKKKIEHWRKYVDKALPMEEALRVMDEEPERIDINSLKMCFKPLEIATYT